MSIILDIAAWDGKSSDDIQEVYDRYSQESSFVSEIILLAKQETLQKGATWLLKRHAENIGCLDPDAVNSIYQLAQELKHWESKLHVLQSIPHMPIPKTQKKKVEKFLRNCLVDEAIFVRAWAYSGFYEFARQFSEFQEEAEQLLEIAIQDEPASVRSKRDRREPGSLRKGRSVKGSKHLFKYSLAYVVEGQCVLRYDNEAGKGDHKHVGNEESGYSFTTAEQLLQDFWVDVDEWRKE